MGCFKGKKESISLQVWPLNDPEKDIFPEQAQGIVEVDENSVGIAFSGGGSRAHTLCAGYLRALNALGHSQHITYISAVSGGSWASSIYTFAHDEEKILLGEETHPSTCTVDYVHNGNPGKLAQAVAKRFALKSSLVKCLTCGLKDGALWQKLIGCSLLQDFDLDGKLMAANEAHKEAILKRNEKNKSLIRRKDDIVVPIEGRPFLIINGTIGGPNGYASGWGNSLQFTPLYSGVPFYRRNQKMPYMKVTCCGEFQSFVAAMKNEDPKILRKLYEQQMVEGDFHKTSPLTIGGGVVETFAFGTSSLHNQEHYFGHENAEGKIKKGKLFQIEDAVGVSSAAFASAVENFDVGAGFCPSADYFPVLDHKVPQFSEVERVHQLRIGDGGLYENTGMLALLQRGIRKVVCFINTYLRLDMNFKIGRFNNENQILNGNDPKMKPYYCADTQLLSLFGAVEVIQMESNYASNAVFEKEKLNEVMTGLVSSVLEGNGAVSKHVLKLLRNDDWNIIGGYDVEVLFVYNEVSYNFMKELPDDTLNFLGNAENSFGDFPFFKTVFQSNRVLSPYLNYSCG